MSWNLRFHPAVRQDLRRLSQEAHSFIFASILPGIAANPYRGEALRGPLKDLWKYRSGEYRIAYAIDEKRHEVVILEVGTRGGFYERLRRRMKR